MVKGLEIQGTRVAAQEVLVAGVQRAPRHEDDARQKLRPVLFELAVEAPAVQDRHPQVAHDEVVADHRQLFQRGATGVAPRPHRGRRP